MRHLILILDILLSCQFVGKSQQILPAHNHILKMDGISSASYGTAASVINLGTQYTIEIQFAYSTTNNVYLVGNNVSGTYTLRYTPTNNSVYMDVGSDAGDIREIALTTTLLQNKIYTLKVIRNGLTYTAYVDGVYQGVSSAFTNNNSMTLAVLNKSNTAGSPVTLIYYNWIKLYNSSGALTYWWDFNAGIGSTIFSIVGSNNITITNSAWTRNFY